ncbi:phosphotriesterase family protein [Gordonia terrae]|uniref:Phosphotriesterase n=2 Tax=Gordonia terrae TaxID=2055 RepID=A0AAD0K446_9ACTN|nr:phosphotriesterase [Gordonia terrae]VTR08781.1 putative metal-dependent hydrolase with the TIM-barrel fold [Clostridioides difficile]ANY21535.1 phosphotriesterase [Gordonia terrae]AWO82265.1 phosphotriesterase [Gordonia terrae]VTS16570.1 Parathion hydrolase precursor [Gordonia terrae]GAB42924.1 N-acylhomoserine lactonase [Gordonia terrae NBRC 100016]
MATVQTATGSIDSADLGNVLVHEHVFIVNEEFRQNYQDDWDEDEKVAEAIRDLTELKELGIDTILDPTVLGLGRYIPRIQRIAEQIDLNIVVATGLYTYNDIPFQFHYAGPGMLFDVPEPLVTLFTKDLTEGIADTGVRAAFLKCAIESQGLTPGVERVMRAVGQTSAQTGAPITVHTDPHSQSGLVAQKVLAEEGADLTKVVIGHSGDSVDLDYLMKLADAGSVLGMDRFGLDLLLPFDERVNTVAELCKRGYADRMALAHDAACFIDWFDHEAKKQALPKWNYRHISEEVLPALRERGVSEADITTMLVDVPRRYFE